MSIRIVAAAFVVAVAATAAPHTAIAQNVMKECGTEYQAAKSANTLNGQKWQEFLAACRTRRAASAAPASTTVPATPTTTAAPTAPKTAPPATASAPAPTAPASNAAAKPASGGRAAMLERQKACGAEWKAQKVELRKANPALKWPQYWSDCNKRMKAAAVR